MKNLGKKISVYVSKEDIAKGQPNTTRDCPVARALFRAGVRRVAVDTSAIVGIFAGKKFEKPTPAAAKRFIRQYDCQMSVAVKPFRFSFSV